MAQFASFETATNFNGKKDHKIKEMYGEMSQVKLSRMLEIPWVGLKINLQV